MRTLLISADLVADGGIGSDTRPTLPERVTGLR